LRHYNQVGADAAETDLKPRLLEYYVSKGEASPTTGEILYVLNEKYAAPEVSAAPGAILVARHCGRSTSHYSTLSASVCA
jgi:hypothetical protein